MASATSRDSSRYSGVAITLHWVMAALILFMIWLGHNMEDHETRFQLHKSIGITLLVLTIARIVWRLYNKPPPLPDDVKPLESKLSKFVQFGFYALMLLIPLGGWIMVSVSPFAVPTVLFETVSWPNLPLGRDEGIYDVLAFLHGKGATIGFLGLLVLHVAGAIKHEIGHESGVLKRILPGSESRAAPIKGVLVTLLTSLGFFVAISAVPLLSANSIVNTPIASENTQLDSPITDSELTDAVTVNSNWTVQPENSDLTFGFSHDGRDYTGQFENWTAQIEFYEDDLANSKVLVEVDLTSAVTGKKLYDDSLKAAEWFDIKSGTNASVSLSNFNNARAPGTYISDAMLNIKGLNITVPFSFKLEIAGDKATMSGSTTLNRKGLKLGQDSDPNADWVSEEIVVNVGLRARKK